MGWIDMILSSAVIAAITSYIAVQKTNRLKYITSERAKWRKEIKSIAGKLSECKQYNKKAKRLLTDLKLRLNSYGKKKEYPIDICLNFFADEHIWKEIAAIEAGNEFDKHKDRILCYLELLLKFDWERSKREAKTEQKAVILAIVFVGIIIINVFADFVVVKGNAIKSTMIEIMHTEGLFLAGQLAALLLFLLPSLWEYMGLSRKEKTYNKYAFELVCYFIGETILIFPYMINCKYNICMVFWGVEIVLGSMFMIQHLNGKLNYREYSNCVIKCFVDEPLLIFNTDSAWKDFYCMLFIDPLYNDYGISYKKTSDLEFLSQEQAKELLSKMWGRKKFKKLKKKNKELTEKEFLKAYPKYCKIFVKRGEEIVAGFSLKNYRQFAIDISANKDSSNKTNNHD